MISSSPRRFAPLLRPAAVPRPPSSVLVPSRAAIRSHPCPPLLLLRPRRCCRTMASTSSEPARFVPSVPPPGKYEFLVIVPDKPGAQAKRLEVRPKHFEALQPLIDAGTLKVGGGIFNSLPVGDDPTQWEFGGSALIVRAESKDEILDMLRRDIYTASGVWDVEKVQIWPAKLSFRHP